MTSLADAPRHRKRDVILNEALRQFNEHGFHDTRLEDIASELGAKKPNIAYYYKSKDAILETAYERACDFADAQIACAAAAGTGLERAMRFISAHLQAHAESLTGEREPLALMADLASLDSPDFATIHERYQGSVAAFRGFLNEGLEDGSVSLRSTDAATFFAFNVIHWIPRWLAATAQTRRQQAVVGFCDLLRYGLAADRSRSLSMPIARTMSSDVSHIFDREARNALKKEAFLRTGIRHLNRAGFRNLSLDDIAKELGVTRGAFYYQIADKDALLAECCHRTCDLIERSILLADEGLSPKAIDSLERALRWLFEGHVTELDPLLRPNLIHLLGVAQRAVVNARLRKLTANFAEIMAHGMIDGSIRPIDFDAAEQIVFGSVFAASRRRFAATRLEQSWRPEDEPVSASAAYLEPLILGFAAC